MDRQFAPTVEEELSSIKTLLSDMQELLIGQYIQQLRIYDLLMVLLAQKMPEKADELMKLHEAGDILCPDPALSPRE